jgi:hypothetical protein
MPVPGSQIVGFRPFRDSQERPDGARPARSPIEKRWPPAASVLFISASSLGLWVAIGISLRAIFWTG